MLSRLSRLHTLLRVWMRVCVWPGLSPASTLAWSRTEHVSLTQQTPVAAVLARENKKRKDKEVDYTSNTVAEVAGPSSKPGKKGAKRVKPTPADEADGSSSSSTPAPAPPPAPKKSTAVYVTNLPLDATATEIAETFSKCGIILLTPENEPKIKLYTDDQGNFKGEALVMYFKETSVELAITVLDESELRLGSGARMKVKRAEWGDGGGGGKGNGAGGDQQAGEKKPKKQMTEAEKKELNRRMRKMEKWVTVRCALGSRRFQVADVCLASCLSPAN